MTDVDRPTARAWTSTSLRTRVAALACLLAVVAWIVYAAAALSTTTIVSARDAPAFIATIGVLVALDAIVAVRAWWKRASRLDLAYLGLRVLLSGVGFLLVTLPLYVVAFLALWRAPGRSAEVDPNGPHAYSPASAAWFRSLTPLSWSRNLLGASQYSASACAVCGRGPDDPLHAEGADTSGVGTEWPS